MEHKCEQLNSLESDEYGSAINIIYKREDGSWGVSNGEYESHPIYYCPCCGVKLE